MKYFYDVGRKNYLPIDKDRDLLDFRLVQCPRCGERRADSVHISPTDPAKLGSAELRRAWRKLASDKSDDAFDRWPLYEEFARLLKQEFPGMYVSPSIMFGTVDVEVDDPVDIAAPGMGIIVLKKEGFERLRKRGVVVDVWPIKTRYTKTVKQHEEYVELAAQPVASAAPGQNIRLCSVCNRSNYPGWNGPCILDESTVPPDIDAFRIIESPTEIIVTERFVNAVQDFDCGNILWKEVRTG